MATFDATSLPPVTPPTSALPTKQVAPTQNTIKQRWRVVRA